MVTKLGDIEVQVFSVPDRIKLTIKFGDPGTEATILIRHADSMENTRIEDDVLRLAEALRNGPQVSDLPFEIKFGDHGTEATINIRHADSMPNPFANIDVLRLAEALQNSARPQG